MIMASLPGRWPHPTQRRLRSGVEERKDPDLHVTRRWRFRNEAHGAPTLDNGVVQVGTPGNTASKVQKLETAWAQAWPHLPRHRATRRFQKSRSLPHMQAFVPSGCRRKPWVPASGRKPKTPVVTSCSCFRSHCSTNGDSDQKLVSTFPSAYSHMHV